MIKSTMPKATPKNKMAFMTRQTMLMEEQVYLTKEIKWFVKGIAIAAWIMMIIIWANAI